MRRVRRRVSGNHAARFSRVRAAHRPRAGLCEDAFAHCVAACALRAEGKTTVSQIIRRLGVPPRHRGSTDGATCPDIFELSDGNFAIIGTDVTDSMDVQLPADAARADYERIVVITRETLVKAKADIPDV